jgi:hypothetical protein
MVNEDELDLRPGVATPSRAPGSPLPTSRTDTTQESDDLSCECSNPDLALDESAIGPARVQVLWCDSCETLLTTISEVQDEQ